MAVVVCLCVAGCVGERTPESGLRQEAGGGEGDGSWGLGWLELVGPVRTIEAFEDSVDGYFADIVMVEPLEEDGLLVVDRMLPAALLMDGDGDVVSRKGRRGAGPGELSGETPSASASDSSVWVIDHMNGRLQPFRLEGDSLAALDPIRPTFLPEVPDPAA